MSVTPFNNAYPFYAPSGVPGDITRPDETLVEPVMLGTPNAQAYGIPVKFNGSGQAIPFDGSESGSEFQGVLARQAPAISPSNLPVGQDMPFADVPQGMVPRGYIAVICVAGTPVRGQAVYVRTVATTGHAIGDFDATSVPGSNVLITNASWAVNGKDSSNNAELRLNIPR